MLPPAQWKRNEDIIQRGEELGQFLVTDKKQI